MLVEAIYCLLFTYCCTWPFLTLRINWLSYWSKVSSLHRAVKQVRAHVADAWAASWYMRSLCSWAHTIFPWPLLLSVGPPNINTWNYMLVRIHVILITRDRSAKSMKQSHPLAIHLVDSMPQESGENAAHPWSCKLGKYSGKNNARDFWNFCKVPVATWLKESDLFPCERTINSYV